MHCFGVLARLGSELQHGPIVVEFVFMFVFVESINTWREDLKALLVMSFTVRSIPIV